MVYSSCLHGGIWLETLLLDLWPAESAQESMPPNRSRTPSWSWAAVNGLISIPYKELGPEWKHLDILHCQLTLKDPQAPFGEVAAGFLQVRGYLIEIKIKSDGSATKTVAEGREPTENGRMSLDCEAERCGVCRPTAVGCSRRIFREVGCGEHRTRRVGLFKLPSTSKKSTKSGSMIYTYMKLPLYDLSYP